MASPAMSTISRLSSRTEVTSEMVMGEAINPNESSAIDVIMVMLL